MSIETPQPDSEADIDPDTLERDDAVIGVALRWSLVVFGIATVAAGSLAYVLWPRPEVNRVRETKLARVELRNADDSAIPHVKFTDVTRAAGITFRHENGAIGKKLLPETMGGGTAFLDFDGDGDQDLLFVNSLRRWPWDRQAGDAPEATMALYRNDGKGNFADATAGSGLEVSMYGMGVAVGDYDSDGRVDVFVTALGFNRLFHNEGGGKFRDVTAAAGVAGEEKEWSTSTGFFDYDNDGDLDLFVCNYLQWSREYDEGQNFQLTGGGRAYGRPQNFEGTYPYLYRNDGKGKFTEVGEEAGLHIRNPSTGVPMAKSLGVAFADFDKDGRVDIVVANDTVQNFLFHNQGDGSFREIAAQSGIAFDMNGNARGAMGIDVARFRDNGATGVAIGNFANEMMALYVTDGDEVHFMDEAISTGIGPNTRLSLTFGVFYGDYDLDGRLDIFSANGHLEEDINRVQPSQHYEQPPQLFWNCGSQEDTEFLPVPADRSGPDFAKPMVGRGASYADIDNDGDMDILLTAAGQTPRLLRNEQEQGHHWLRFRLTGTHSNRDAIGACIEVQLADGRVLHRQVLPTRSYLSQVELPVTFGLGKSTEVKSVTVCWPDGSKQDVAVTDVDRTYEVKQTSTPASLRHVQETPKPNVKATSLVAPAAHGARLSAISFRPNMPGRQLAANSRPPISELALAGHASCGNYVLFGLQSQDESDGNDSPSPSGPSCSGCPQPQSGLAPTAPRLSDRGAGQLIAGDGTDAGADHRSESLPPSELACVPPLYLCAIFRPPRCA